MRLWKASVGLMCKLLKAHCGHSFLMPDRIFSTSTPTTAHWQRWPAEWRAPVDIGDHVPNICSILCPTLRRSVFMMTIFGNCRNWSHKKLSLLSANSISVPKPSKALEEHNESKLIPLLALRVCLGSFTTGLLKRGKPTWRKHRATDVDDPKLTTMC